MVPETVAGRVENYSDKGALTVDGTTYEASIIKSDVATSQNSRELTKPTVYTDTTTEAVLYLDSCGNVVAVENNIDENIVYVARTHDETGFGTTITVYGFFAGGGKGVYTLASYNGSTETAKLRNVGEGLYFYTVDGNRINLRDTNTTAGGSAYLLAHQQCRRWHYGRKPQQLQLHHLHWRLHRPHLCGPQHHLLYSRHH